MPMRRMLVLALALSTPACASVEKVTATQADYSLNRAQFAELADLANSGSQEAAMRLSDRFFYDLTEGKLQETRDQSLTWALIGAENGSNQAQFRAYQLLSESHDRRKQIRALFWLKVAAKNGNEDAQFGLEECPTVDSQLSDGRPCFGREE
jgi:TPR repeat protein